MNKFVKVYANLGVLHNILLLIQKSLDHHYHWFLKKQSLKT